MIKNTNLISDENGYKRYNDFEIDEKLVQILASDYFSIKTSEFKKQELIDSLYKKNFEDKYDRVSHEEIFKLYIDNNKFKEKAQFIYSIIDLEKYTSFINKNPEIENPNDYTIKYNILDSDGVKVEIYNLTINDISFVF